MSDSGSWKIPQELFDELNEEFNFDIDLFATEENSKCTSFYTNYLGNVIQDNRGIRRVRDLDEISDYHEELSCWMNPPYSDPKPFIEKAWDDSRFCKIVCVVKCDPSTEWWSIFWDYKDEIVGKDFEHELDGIKYYRDDYTGDIVKASGPKPGCEVRYFPKKFKITPPKSLKWERVNVTLALIIMDRRDL